MKLCSKCNERPAVVFITRVEGDKSYPEGFCLKCARELNIGPINDMLNSMNLPEEAMAELNESLSDVMEGIIDEETAVKLASIFLNTEFEGDRHVRRVDMITAIEEGTFSL